MFPISWANVNDLKNNSANLATEGDVTGSSGLLVPGRATAATDIPQGAITSSIDPELLRGRADIVQVKVTLNVTGEIILDKSSMEIWPKDMHWIRALRIAEDCHSYNVQLQLQKTNSVKLVLQVVKPILEGQEFLLWFSEEILAMLQMVFLTPANIQGQKRYVCTYCSTLYESPNPLKLHMILECGRQTIVDLWEKIARLLKDNKLDNPKVNEFTFKLSPYCYKSKPRIALDLSKSENKRPLSQPSMHTTCQTSPNLYRPYTEPPSSSKSAFRPFQKTKSNPETTFTHPYLLPNISESQTYWAGLSFNQNLFSNNYLHGNSPNFNDEAQMETLMSSLGKSREGHVCLYCGKSYSRKYGLKIHIRTHTGYKPLKCKFCLRPFGDPSNLNKHVRLHAEGETPYKCELCGKILVRRRDLERHLKSRHMSDILPGRSIVEDENNPSDITDEDTEEGVVGR